MRLAVVSDSDAFGGAEVYARQLLRRAPADVERVLLAAEPVADRLSSQPSGAFAVRALPLARHADVAPALEGALADLRPDVVHVNLVDPASNVAALEAALGSAPTVVTLHLQGSLGPDPGRLRRAYAGVAGALAGSAAIAAQLRDELGVPSERVHRVRNGVDIPVSVRPRSSRPGPLVVGGVGRLTDQKGFDLLVEAARRVDPDGRRMRLVLAGAGRDRERLEQQAAGLPVHFAGHCDDVPALLEGFDVFCLPSRREALSLALLEAMAAGLPCLTTAVGDTADAVGDAALVVRPDDVDALAAGLDRLLADAALREALGRRARERAVRDFDAARMVSQIVRVLAGAAARRPAA